MADGLYALAGFYKRFSKEQGCNDEAQLFVESISKGSIIAKLITYTEKLPFLVPSKIIKFAKRLDAVLDLLSSGKELPNGETEMSQKDLEDTSKIAGVITQKKIAL